MLCLVVPSDYALLAIPCDNDLAIPSPVIPDADDALIGHILQAKKAEIELSLCIFTDL